MIQLSHFSFWAPATDVQLLYGLNLEIKRKRVCHRPRPVRFWKSTFVDEEVRFGPGNLLLPRDEVLTRSEIALRQVGLDGFQRRSINELSGGEKQRVAIASVLAMGPDVLILD